MRTDDLHSENICLLSQQEQQLRVIRLHRIMKDAGVRSMIVRDNANIYYLTGRVFSGYILVDAADDRPYYFVRRPNHLEGDRVMMIRKPEEIPAMLTAAGADTEILRGCALELDTLTYSHVVRLQKALGLESPANASGLLRRCRSVKTLAEQEKIKLSGIKQTSVYKRVPHLYKEGMTDIELQIEIERASRLEGCLGQFRVSGDEMELYMGNVLTGENANTPSPYDFAMGGAGADPSLPVGANGTEIRRGMPVMIDVNGNYTGYMTDMTRCYVCGEPSDEALRANSLSRRICEAIAQAGRPGTAAADLYELARKMAADEGMEEYFMGHRSHAGFVGHGVGIEINELPVLAPRSRDILEAGQVIAVEPKFVIPGVGAVGVENTYIVRADAPMEKITLASEDIVNLD